MSRTTKDRPMWVVTNDPSSARRAVHHHDRIGRPGYADHCTLDEPESPTSTRPYTPCYYLLTGYRSYDPHHGPSATDCRQMWWGPERVRTRDGLRRVRGQYNATGDINDVDVPDGRPHRHSATWLWW